MLDAPARTRRAQRAAAERAHLESNMPLLRILHDNARGAIIGLLSCMRSRLRRRWQSNLAAFLHLSRADVTMDFNQPRAWVDPHTESGAGPQPPYDAARRRDGEPSAEEWRRRGRRRSGAIRTTASEGRLAAKRRRRRRRMRSVRTVVRRRRMVRVRR